MKFVVNVVCILLFAASQAPTAAANNLQENQQTSPRLMPGQC